MLVSSNQSVFGLILFLKILVHWYSDKIHQYVSKLHNVKFSVNVDELSGTLAFKYDGQIVANGSCTGVAVFRTGHYQANTSRSEKVVTSPIRCSDVCDFVGDHVFAVIHSGKRDETRWSEPLVELHCALLLFFIFRVWFTPGLVQLADYPFNMPTIFA